MKKVFNDISHIAHLWANQLQDEARNGGNGNFYFNDSVIYSYGSHFPIAKHVENSKGEKAVLFTTDTYGPTTSKHVRTVEYATSHLNKIYCRHVPRFDFIPHSDNFNAWLRNITNIAHSLANARKPEKYLSLIAAEYAQAEKYAQFFGIKIPKDLQKAGIIKNSDELVKFQREKAQKEAKQNKIEHQKALIKWRSFETYNLYLRDGYDYLRFNPDSNRIETSQAVKIPLDIAAAFFKTIIETNEKGGCTNCDIRLMNYQVSEINSKFIKVGCHRISMLEINRIAKLLNWA